MGGGGGLGLDTGWRRAGFSAFISASRPFFSVGGVTSRGPASPRRGSCSPARRGRAAAVRQGGKNAPRWRGPPGGSPRGARGGGGGRAEEAGGAGGVRARA